ncbi:MAG TPA: MFS transporter [Verrucomicrobiae bacterium]|nr:MFS transporter [Verrucomicrobiae bacterium]
MYSPEKPPAASAPVTKKWKWKLCGILFLATILNYLDRQTMGLCKAPIMEEFQINNEEFGNLLAAFRWTYASMHIVAGFVADRFSLRMLFALAVGIWSFAGAAAFWVGSVLVFKWTRALLGVGEAVNWPFSTRIVANMLPREDRGLGMGIFNSGAAVGALLAPFVITPIAAAAGWRWAFFSVGAIGFFWVALWLWFTRGGRARAFANDPATIPTSRSLKEIWKPFRTILSQPTFWVLILVSITINPCWYFCCDWVPGYLKEQSGFSFLRAGLLSTFIFLGGDLGNYVGGGCVKFLTHRGWSVRKARGCTVLLGAAMASSIAVVPHVNNTYVAIALLALAGLGINTIVPNQTACQTEVSFQNTAQLAGLTGLAANIVAALVNPRIGRYVDVTQHYDLIFYLVGFFPWVAAAAILIFDSMISRRSRLSAG